MARFSPRPDVAERRARVLQLRIEQRPYADIALELGISSSTARTDYQRALEQLQADQKAAAAQARDLELAKLDMLEQAVWEVLRRKHLTVSHGKIIGHYTGRPARDPDTGEILRDLDGQPVAEFVELEDDAPVLQAADRLVRIAQRRATLTGLDAPARVEVSDATDRAIRELALELAASGLGDVEPGGEAAPARDPAQSSS